MAGANPASPGTPGRVGETRHSAGATRHWRGTRNAAPTCRRCGNRSGGREMHRPRHGAPWRSHRSGGGAPTGGRRPPRDLPGLRGRTGNSRARSRLPRRAASRRPGSGADASGPGRKPRRPRRAVRRKRSRPLPGTASRSRRIGRQPNRHRRANRGTAAAPGDLLQGAGRPIKNPATPRPSRPRCGRGAADPSFAASPFPSTTTGRGRLRGRVVHRQSDHRRWL